MSQDVWNAGAEYQLASNTVVGVNYIHTDLNRTIEDVGSVVDGNEVYLYPSRLRGRSGSTTPSSCPSIASPTTGSWAAATS
jgi:hypothetical protein